MAAVDFSIVLRSIRGESLQEQEVVSGALVTKGPLTLRRVCVDALMGFDAAENQQHPSGTEMLHRYMLAERIEASSEPIELTAAEVTKLLDRIAKMWNTLVYGASAKILDPASCKS